MSGLRFLPPMETEAPEHDRVAGMPHPREMLDLVGHKAQEAEFLEAYNGGALHHAFLLTGPEGIGKATFAYRAARFLLAQEGQDSGGMFGGPVSLEVPGEARAAHLVAQESHPDLGILKRRYDSKTKKFRAEISVEDTRNTLALFEKTAAFGGWRAIIVDSADDMNAASANALLKTLEEPPARAIFFLIAHQPQRLLPTIRSRCRVMRFNPLEDDDLSALLASLRGQGADADVLARAGGSIRHALRLSDPKTKAFLAQVDSVLKGLPRKRASEIDAIAEATHRGVDGEQAFADLIEAVEAWLHARARAAAEANNVMRAADYAEAQTKMREEAATAEAFNLDKRAYVISLFEMLASLASAG
ncbi:MAG: DNA polymerase III subunit delta' [Proteobacteria bacterium]|nr:DNA polymerase III subunit delta' [Pseudomonadota bacterium]